MTAITIDPDRKAPPFEQIKAAIIELIATGQLPPDHRLPTIRQLAGDLDVAPNTVARAYRELEADGLVRARGRRGTVVIGVPDEPTAEVEADAIVDAVRTARQRGVSTSEIMRTVARALAAG